MNLGTLCSVIRDFLSRLFRSLSIFEMIFKDKFSQSSRKSRPYFIAHRVTHLRFIPNERVTEPDSLLDISKLIERFQAVLDRIKK